MKKKICIVTTVPFAMIMYMKPHITMLAKEFEVTLITNGSEGEVKSLLYKNVKFIPLRISREINIMQDSITLFKLYTIFNRERFDVVHSLMPKTSLLAMLAAFLSFTPNRIHTFTGQVWANKSGLTRRFLMLLDKIAANCATGLFADSNSQKQYLIENGIVSDINKIVVLAHGSVCGVDIERFKPNPIARKDIRNRLKIPHDAVIYLFIGRINKDKGVHDLVEAFDLISSQHTNVHLLLVGPDDGWLNTLLNSKALKSNKKIHLTGFTDKPEDYMACADIFCLPSYREGFGSVIIEAASVGLPSIATNIYGVIDAIVEDETGYLFPPKNIIELKRLLIKLTKDNILYGKLSLQAQARAHNDFSQEILVAEMYKYYSKMLNE